jgi:hypothetical protein
VEDLAAYQSHLDAWGQPGVGLDVGEAGEGVGVGRVVVVVMVMVVVVVVVVARAVEGEEEVGVNQEAELGGQSEEV